MFYLLRPILFRTCRVFLPDYALRISLGTFSCLQILNVCPFDYTAGAVSGKVERSLTVLTTPIAWMLSVTSAIDRPKCRIIECAFLFSISKF